MSKTTIAKTRAQRNRRNWRVRSRISGTKSRPRVRVNISNRHVSAQLIDDENQSTIAASTTVGKKSLSGSLSEKAAWVGQDIAKKAKAKKINKAVLDRGYRLYHGRVKALAEAARDNGLEF